MLLDLLDETSKQSILLNVAGLSVRNATWNSFFQKEKDNLHPTQER